jgi:hypothetical protein
MVMAGGESLAKGDLSPVIIKRSKNENSPVTSVLL